MTLQDLIFKLSDYWAAQGCLIQQPLDIEMGAGTMHPETFLRVLGPQGWNVAYVQPSRRPADGKVHRVAALVLPQRHGQTPSCRL